MAPIIAALLQAGLPLLASAIQSKGAEIVKDKLGVDIGDMLGSEEGRIKLKQLEHSHEEWLIEAGIRKNQQEIEVFKIEVADRASARQREVEMVKAGAKNYRPDVMFLLAVTVICFVVYIVWKDEQINEYVKGIFTLVLGRFLGYLDNIYNYEFGTTRSSQSKNDTIDTLSKRSNK